MCGELAPWVQGNNSGRSQPTSACDAVYCSFLASFLPSCASVVSILINSCKATERWASKTHWVLTRGWVAHEGEHDSFLHVTTKKPGVERTCPKVPHHLWACRTVYPESAHRLLLFPYSENNMRAFTGRTGKPGNPYLQMRHFWMFLNNLRLDLIPNDGATHRLPEPVVGYKSVMEPALVHPSLQCGFRSQHTLAQTPTSQLLTIHEIYKAACIWNSTVLTLLLLYPQASHFSNDNNKKLL